MGDRIEYRDGRWVVPDHPIIPFIEGDGTGPDIWRAARRVFDAVVEQTSRGERRVEWLEILAGEKAFKETGSWLPAATLETIRQHRVAIKGPLTTPVGGGIRSLNVTLRQLLELYACVRPVRYFPGVPSPMREPQKLDVVIFRENIEDVYSGVEYRASTPEADALIAFLTERFGAKIRPGSAIGIKPMSKFGSQRLVAKAIAYALRVGRRSVTLVHKGNIMKFTEGGFREGGYEIAKERFGDKTVPVSEGGRGTGGDQGSHHRRDVRAARAPAGRVLRDRGAEPERRPALRRRRGTGRRAWPRAGGERGRRLRRIRGDPRHGAQVRRARQGEPRECDPVRGDDVRGAGLDGRLGGDRARARGRAPVATRHLRPGPPDARRHRGLDLVLRRVHNRACL